MAVSPNPGILQRLDRLKPRLRRPLQLALRAQPRMLGALQRLLWAAAPRLFRQ
jgi:hypothetical protein